MNTVFSRSCRKIRMLTLLLLVIQNVQTSENLPPTNPLVEHRSENGKGEAGASPAGQDQAQMDWGRTLYRESCASCHGEEGNGRGSGKAFHGLRTLARNFRDEPLRYISTDGAPSDDDYLRTIYYGRGEMPSFRNLKEEEMRALIPVLRKFYREGLAERLKARSPNLDDKTIERVTLRRAGPGKPIPWKPPGAEFKADVEAGRALFKVNCAECHGEEGRGAEVKGAFDREGHTIKSRDLTTGDFRGGSIPQELFWRIRCGIPGTPMPAAATLRDGDVWQLVVYVRELAKVRK